MRVLPEVLGAGNIMRLTFASPLPHLMVVDDQRIISLRLRLQVRYFISPFVRLRRDQVFQLMLLSGPRVHRIVPHRSPLALSYDSWS